MLKTFFFLNSDKISVLLCVLTLKLWCLSMFAFLKYLTFLISSMFNITTLFCFYFPECDCGAKHRSCEFQNGKKKCECLDGYDDNNGICQGNLNFIF